MFIPTRQKILFQVAIVALLVSGCSYYPALEDWDRDVVLEDEFSSGLRQGYVELADSELAQGDRSDAGHYRYKVQSIARGMSIDPEGLSTRKIPTEKINELAEARNFLMTAFARDAKNTAPVKAAEAQVAFDCWVEQQEENFQSEDIKSCRDRYEVAANALKEIFAKEDAANAPEIIELDDELEMPKPYIVFFKFDKSDLGQSAKSLLKKVAEEVSYFNPSKIIVSGHADRAGPESYNYTLSEKRAYEVAGELGVYGVKSDILQIKAYGEKEPKVSTKDGVSNPQNRFVEIIFIK
jgi:outer membrane protein OmpA-like peptidoglycan-associated protein